MNFFKAVIVIFCLLFIFLFFYYSKLAIIKEKQITTIAICPTYFDLIDKNKSDEIVFIKTNSTAESLKLLENNVVNYVIAGRKLKPTEGQYDSVWLDFDKGYSFLSNENKIIYFEDLSNFDIYTDLDVNLIKDKIPNNEIFVVADVYNFLDKGVVVTSWDNTDYSRAEIIHILNQDGSRNKISRSPVIYCKSMCRQDSINLLSFIYDQ